MDKRARATEGKSRQDSAKHELAPTSPHRGKAAEAEARLGREESGPFAPPPQRRNTAETTVRDGECAINSQRQCAVGLGAPRGYDKSGAGRARGRPSKYRLGARGRYRLGARVSAPGSPGQIPPGSPGQIPPGSREQIPPRSRVGWVGLVSSAAGSQAHFHPTPLPHFRVV